MTTYQFLELFKEVYEKMLTKEEKVAVSKCLGRHIADFFRDLVSYDLDPTTLKKIFECYMAYNEREDKQNDA